MLDICEQVPNPDEAEKNVVWFWGFFKLYCVSNWFHWETEQKLVPVCCNWHRRNPGSSLAVHYLILLIEALDSFLMEDIISP